MNPRVLPSKRRLSSKSAWQANAGSEDVDFDDGTSTQRAESEIGSDDDESQDGTLAGRFAGGSERMVIRWSATETRSAGDIPLLSWSLSNLRFNVSTQERDIRADSTVFAFEAELRLAEVHLGVLSDALRLR